LDEVRSLARTLGEALTARAWRVATAESLTGGGIGAALSAVPGASTWFAGGAITYQTDQKTRQLGVPPALVARYGVVSGECVHAMAAGVAETFAVECALAVSGLAGPDGGTNETPVGTVWIATRIGTTAREHCYHFGAIGREEVRTATVSAAIQQLVDGLDALA
jgi:nicotinamide-nucleotide amidase